MRVPHGRPFSIRVGERSEAAHLRLSGRFDAAAIPTLDAVADRVGDRDVLMDLGGVTFMDGAAWLAVMALEHRVRDRGAALRVLDVRGPIRKIFERTETEYLLTEPIAT